MTTVTHTLLNDSAKPYPNRTVRFTLCGTVDGVTVPVAGFTTAGQLVAYVPAVSRADGSLSVDLPPNASITPTGTFYRVSSLPRGGDLSIIVPESGTHRLFDLLTVDPPNLTPPIPAQGPAGPPFVVKGDVADHASLPATGEPGQGWVTSDTGHVWAWDPAVPGWVDAGQFQGSPGVGLEYRWTGDQLEVRSEGSDDPWSPSPHLTGTPGSDGTDGDDGVGIASASVDDGDLTLTLTDASTLGPWHVAGTDGAAATIAVDPASGGVAHGTPTSVENTGTASAAKLKILVEEAADGKNLEFAWDDDKLGVRQEGDTDYDYSPALTGPAGAGVPDPASVPDGQVLTTDAGAAVWAAPAAGASIWEYWGQGRPDVPATLDTAGTAWVSAATQGAVFHSTTGDQGAQVWTKTAAGWVVTVGDTGWRNMPVPSLTGITSVGSFVLRRIATQVIWAVSDANVTATGAYKLISSLPSGFGTATWQWASVYVTGVIKGALGGNTGAGMNMIIAASGNFNSGSVSYATADPWPSTLPGSPA